MRVHCYTRGLLAMLFILALSTDSGANIVDNEFSMESIDVYNDICAPTDGATYHAYCDGETKETSTAEVAIRGVVSGKCEDFGFSSDALTCLNGNDAFRLSMTLMVDEANHIGCSISFNWGIVPVRGDDRICSPIVCTSDKTDDAACSRISPIEVSLDIPVVSHEVRLQNEQFSPYEYILLQQPEYFPQRKKHFPITQDPSLLQSRSSFESAFTSNQGTFTPDDDDLQIWGLIDPNYESKGKDDFYCKRGSSKDASGKGQCCFRGKRYAASDEDGDDNDLSVGLAQSDSVESPSRLDFCTNTQPGFGKASFAWSKADESQESTPKIYNCEREDGRCNAHGGYYPKTRPYTALFGWVNGSITRLNVGDFRETDSGDAYSEFNDVEIAGIDVSIGDDDDDQTAYNRILRNVYPLSNAPPELTGRSNPAFSITQNITLEAYHKYLQRDAKNTATTDEADRLENGAWVTTPMDGTSSRMRRLRCGYCSSGGGLENMPCPTTPGGISDDRRFKPCPFGDVSQDASNPANRVANPSTHESDDDGDGGSIQWSEIRHVRAYATSFWFLGTTPVCSAMKPKSGNSVTHTKVILHAKKLDPDNPGDSLDTEMDLTIHDTTAYGRRATTDWVRADISPGESDVKSLSDDTSGAYMRSSDRITVCDSRLYDTGTYTKDHFASVAPTDPFVNPYDSLTNPLVPADFGTCVGCMSSDQFAGLGDESELLLWYYMSKEQYADQWRRPGVSTFTQRGSTINDLSLYQTNVLYQCGKAGVGMDLFAVDGCDALAEDELTKTSLPGQTPYIVPDRSNKCDALHSENNDLERSCQSDVPFIMPDALACSGRLPRLCAPTFGTPAARDKQMASDANTARNKFNTGVDKSTFNLVDWTTHGHLPDVNLDEPNNWLGIGFGSDSKRALYSTNKRNPRVAPKKKAIRESVINLFVTDRFAEFATVFVPCIYEIDYPACILSSPEADYDTFATGTFNFQIAPSAPDIIPTQDYVMDINMGGAAKCVLGFASQSVDTYKHTFTVTVSDTTMVAKMAFRCDLIDPQIAISDTQAGVLTVQANHNPMIKVPIMSCMQQNEFLASFSFPVDIVYTPEYPAGADPCLAISAAVSTRKGNVPAVRTAEDESDAAFPESDDDDVESTPTPAATPTPLATSPLVDLPDDADNIVDDGSDAIGPAKSPPAAPTPTPTPATLEEADAMTPLDADVQNSEPEQTKVWMWVLVGLVVFGAVAISMFLIYWCCIRSSGDDVYDDL